MVITVIELPRLMVRCWMTCRLLSRVRPVMLIDVASISAVSEPDLAYTLDQTYFYRRAFYRLVQLEINKIKKIEI